MSKNKKFKDVVLVYDKENRANLNNIGYEDSRFECKCTDLEDLDCDRHIQVF